MISATGTDIGKTYVAAGLAYTLAKQGKKKVAYYKPIQSGGEERDGKLIAPDVEFVRAISEGSCPIGCYNTYCFIEPVSPHLAAEINQVEFDINKVVKTYNRLIEHYDYVIVEGAGGLAVPLIREKLWLYELAKLLHVDVVLVADAGVGTLNHTLQSYAFAKSKGLKVPLVMLNHYCRTNKAHVDNKMIIRDEIQEAEVGVIGSCALQEARAIREDYTYWLGGIDIECILTGEENNEQESSN